MKFADNETRYEFRKFGNDLSKARDILAARGNATVQPASRETYIVTRLNIESNVKVRGGRLQVIASIEEPELIERILAHRRERGEEGATTASLGARAPPQAELF